MDTHDARIDRPAATARARRAWLEAARTLLAKRTRAGFHRRVQVAPSELDSIVRLVQSHVDLRPSRLLA